MRPSVLMVSKPVAPPWNDSSKNLVKDLATAGRAFVYHVLTPADAPLPGDGIVSDGVYRGGGAHTPPLQQNLRVLARLLKRDDTAISHFFFAPNPRTSLAARAALRVRRRRTVQTVCSAPKSYVNIERLLFAERVVVLSRHTRDALLAAGIADDRLCLIPPGIQLPRPPDPGARLATRRRHGLAEDAEVVIYPGDYQFSRAADTVARAVIALDRPQTTVVFACRIKQEASRQEEQRISRMLASAGLSGRVRMVNQVPDILDLIAACDLCVLPAESLYAKMDVPLVLIEALALGVPIVVADRAPLCEVLVDEVGASVPPEDPAALAAAVAALLDAPDRRAQMSETARRAAREHFAIETISRRHEELYQDLLSQPLRS